MQITDEQLSRWTNPASANEDGKAERTEQMIREAIKNHHALKGLPIRVHAKGSVKNNTNVRLDSDVDVAVEYQGMIQLEYTGGAHFGTTGLTLYSGPYKDALHLYKASVGEAMEAAFGARNVDGSGNRVFRVRESSKSLAADVVPCTTYQYQWLTSAHRGIELILDRPDGLRHYNYPDHHLINGRDKNSRTGRRYKSVVRIIKNIENQLVDAKKIIVVPSFLIECLVYNVPDATFITATSWREAVIKACQTIWTYAQMAEPSTGRWTEVNGIKWLFSPNQRWTRDDATVLAYYVHEAVTT